MTRHVFLWVRRAQGAHRLLKCSCPGLLCRCPAAGAWPVFRCWCRRSLRQGSSDRVPAPAGCCPGHGVGERPLTLHLGARAEVRALIALSALDSSTKEMVAFSSSRATICAYRPRGGGQAGLRSGARTTTCASGAALWRAGRAGGRVGAGAVPGAGAGGSAAPNAAVAAAAGWRCGAGCCCCRRPRHPLLPAAPPPPPGLLQAQRLAAVHAGC